MTLRIGIFQTKHTIAMQQHNNTTIQQYNNTTLHIQHPHHLFNDTSNNQSTATTTTKQV
jgi:hypothetical protein